MPPLAALYSTVDKTSTKATTLNYAALYTYYKVYIGPKRLLWPAFYSALGEGQVGRGQIGRPVAKNIQDWQ